MTSTLPPLAQAFSGALGGAVANASAYPLDLVCTRLQTSHSRERQGIYATLRKIIKKRGFTGLYEGLQTDTAATLISSFFYFYAYSFLRNRVFKRDRLSSNKSTKRSESATLVALEEIVIGFLAGVASRAVSIPLSLITVRLQSEQQQQVDSESVDGDLEKGEDEGGHSSRSIASVFKRIYAEGGLRGFWRGFETTTLLCLNPSLTLFLYQAYRKVFLRGKDREQSSPRHAFVGAAVSNVIAITFLYPLLLAKTRLQASSKSTSSSHSEETDQRTRKSTSMSMFCIWRTAYQHDGLSGLYQGLEAQLFKGFISQGLTMMIKQRIEQIIIALYFYYIQHNSPRIGLR
ncbi:hypothetical protein ACEPAH_7322 [Sanghuangporus vaninii]